DRTRQWVDFLAKEWQEGFLTDPESGRQLKFAGLALQGPGGAPARRLLLKKLKPSLSQSVYAVRGSRPEAVLLDILTYFSSISSNHDLKAQSELVVFGLGNIVGFGQQMIDYLERKADAIKL
ncbi:MAG: hypothetical protein WC524_06725, partial [Candidatus Aminicenantales bacterium]